MKLVVVTGANRGLGRTYVELLLRETEPWKVVMTARDADHGQAVRNEIAELTQAHERLLFRQLDIASAESISAFRDYIAAEFDGIDVLVNNAGIFNREEPGIPQPTLLVNYEMTVEFTDALLPLLKPRAHVLFVSSEFGKKEHISNEAIIARAFAEDLTRSQLHDLYQEYLAAATAGEAEAQGWNKGAYFNSKFLLNTYVRVLAKELKAANSEVRVNALTPGWCRTDMGGASALKSAEEGVQTYLHLTRYEGDISGAFWKDSAIDSF